MQKDGSHANHKLGYGSYFKSDPLLYSTSKNPALKKIEPILNVSHKCEFEKASEKKPSRQKLKLKCHG